LDCFQPNVRRQATSIKPYQTDDGVAFGAQHYVGLNLHLRVPPGNSSHLWLRNSFLTAPGLAPSSETQPHSEQQPRFRGTPRIFSTAQISVLLIHPQCNQKVAGDRGPTTNDGFSGGADRDRTGGLLVANQALSQLSYSPKPCRSSLVVRRSQTLTTNDARPTTDSGGPG
jgi:hypothetical protein